MQSSLPSNPFVDTPFTLEKYDAIDCGREANKFYSNQEINASNKRSLLGVSIVTFLILIGVIVIILLVFVIIDFFIFIIKTIAYAIGTGHGIPFEWTLLKWEKFAEAFQIMISSGAYLITILFFGFLLSFTIGYYIMSRYQKTQLRNYCQFEKKFVI